MADNFKTRVCGEKKEILRFKQVHNYVSDDDKTILPVGLLSNFVVGYEGTDPGAANKTKIILQEGGTVFVSNEPEEVESIIMNGNNPCCNHKATLIGILDGIKRLHDFAVETAKKGPREPGMFMPSIICRCEQMVDRIYKEVVEE